MGIIICVILIGFVGSITDPESQPMGMSSSGLISYELDFYSDAQLLNKIQNVSWGTFDPGENKTLNIFVLNRDKDGFLQMRAENFEPPEIEEFLDLSWNFENQFLGKNNFVEVTFTLHLSDKVKNIENFRFDIVIGY